MAATNENLDDVIASLLDVEEDEAQQPEAPAKHSKSEKPVSLTPRAAKQVMKIKEHEGFGKDLYLRVAVEGGGCAGLNYKLGLDVKNEEDTVTTSEGVEILIDPKHLMYLDGIVIDYPDGLDARGFTFDNPNASENCGCGTSFAV